MTFLEILLQQSGPAETTDMMLVGYVLMIGITVAYLGYLAYSNNSLKKDAILLEEINEQD